MQQNESVIRNVYLIVFSLRETYEMCARDYAHLGDDSVAVLVGAGAHELDRQHAVRARRAAVQLRLGHHAVALAAAQHAERVRQRYDLALAQTVHVHAAVALRHQAQHARVAGARGASARARGRVAALVVVRILDRGAVRAGLGQGHGGGIVRLRLRERRLRGVRVEQIVQRLRPMARCSQQET